MAWSLGNHMIADKVKALLDEKTDTYPPEVRRLYTREQAEAIIHAALWGHGVREDSTAAAYAANNLFNALGLKWWTFDEEDAIAHRELYNKLLVARAAAKRAEATSSVPSKEAK